MSWRPARSFELCSRVVLLVNDFREDIEMRLIHHTFLQTHMSRHVLIPCKNMWPRRLQKLFLKLRINKQYDREKKVVTKCRNRFAFKKKKKLKYTWLNLILSRLTSALARGIEALPSPDSVCVFNMQHCVADSLGSHLGVSLCWNTVPQICSCTQTQHFES